MRDVVVDFVEEWSAITGLSRSSLVPWLGITSSKYWSWKKRFGQVNHHNGCIPRDHWLLPEEVEAIKVFARQHPLNGYRRLTYMMNDQDIVAASPTTIYRVLSKAGLLSRWNPRDSSKGDGFDQPTKPHEHWHIDIAYLNICGTFYYLCTVLDGCSRFVVHWEIRESMREADVELVLQRARERIPGVYPRVISDNGPQFIARDFKSFIRITGMSHVRTSPYYPQSNGKIERWHKTLKSNAIRVRTPLSLEQARTVVTDFVRSYNHERLHSAIGYVTPADRLCGRHTAIQQRRDDRLHGAREKRRRARQAAA